jgi:23S rRNA (adenine2503-C2)-methyltransferase
LLDLGNGYPVECTEMRDVSTEGKEHQEVRSSNDPHVIWNHLKPYEEKWLLTVSTQMGCPHKCKFCDVPSLQFKGNLTQGEIEDQIRFIIEATPYVTKCKKVKIGFARMGEPAHNIENVIGAMINLESISRFYGKDFQWLPCFNTILPVFVMGDFTGIQVLDSVLNLKEEFFDGNLHLQISCNSTDEKVRKDLFGGAEVVPIKDIVKYINDRPLHNRTATLNFIVMKGVPVDVNELMGYGLNPEKFTVKLIPLNTTIRSKDNKLETYANYDNYEKLQELGEEFKKHGIPIVVDSIAKCEEAGLCCGQLAQVFVKKNV